MTLLMQSIISNQLQKTDRISIENTIKPVILPPDLMNDMALPMTQFHTKDTTKTNKETNYTTKTARTYTITR
jgi:hypothetical protein